MGIADPTHLMANASQSPAAPAAHVSFAAFQNPGFKFYFMGTACAMLADNVEHVISYWVMFQKFHSSTLAAFAVISHWVPYLLLSGYIGALADRVDPRRLIQAGMLIFMAVSVCWGILISTDSLRVWHTVVLLSAHGIAGVLWVPSAQLLLHDIVPRQHLPSAVRLGATARYLGTLLGPAVGSALMLGFTPAHGIFFNALIYLPMFLWLWRAPFGPKFRGSKPAPRAAVRGLGDALATIRSLRSNRIILSMTALAGAASACIGTAYQALMPNFANQLGHGNPGVAYWALSAADALGALIGATLLESRGSLQPRTSRAFALAMLWCVALAVFALTNSYSLGLVALFCAGFFEIAFNAMAQALVQLNAPPELRGHVIGVFVMSSLGLRFISGFTVALMGELVGIHGSLSLSAGLLFVIVAILWFGTRAEPRPANA